MRSVMVGLVAVAVLVGGCSDEEDTTKTTEESNTGPTHLDLSGPETTDEVVAEKLKGLTNLIALSLRNTQVTDAGLVYLKELTNLEWPYLEDTKVTDAGVQKLKKALPGCKIYH